MTGALISGPARTAIVFNGGHTWCLQPEWPSPQVISRGLVPHWIADLDSASYYPAAELSGARELLERASRDERGLQLALISMDPASSAPTRDLAEDALEELLEHRHVEEMLQNRLFSRLLPLDATWRETTAPATYQRTRALQEAVLGAQASISAVRAAWDGLAPELFAATPERKEFEALLVNRGAFRLLALADKGQAQVHLLSDRNYQSFTGWRNVLLAWTKAIPAAREAKLEPVARDRGEEKATRGRKSGRPVAPYEAFVNVNRQKDAILDQLQSRSFARVEQFVDDLVRRQVTEGAPALAAKSLSDLA